MLFTSIKGADFLKVSLFLGEDRFKEEHNICTADFGRFWVGTEVLNKRLDAFVTPRILCNLKFIWSYKNYITQILDFLKLFRYLVKIGKPGVDL